MTVAKSQVSTAIRSAEVDEQLPDISGAVAMWSNAISDSLADWWTNTAPDIKALAAAAWLRALTTRPKTLLICAAVCFMGGFGVMLLALFATVLTLLLKVAAIGFAGIALWQWVSGAATATSHSLLVKQPAKLGKPTK